MGTQASLADVAMLAGVSLATASRALSPVKSATVNAELRARVRQAAAELNYVPNLHAQAMRSPVASIGLVVHDIADPVAAAVAGGVLRAAAAAGILVTIGASGADPMAEIKHLETQRRHRAQAVILAGSRFADSDSQRWLNEEIDALRYGGGRVVTIGQQAGNADGIVVADADGAAQLASTLVRLGYRRFAVLAGPEYLQTSEDRLAGFRAGLVAAGVAVSDENVLVTQLSRDGGYTAMRDLVDLDADRDLEIDCVFAVDDSMAMGAVGALRDLGIRVPAEVAVAGFGDIAALRDVVPGLTTVRLPLAEMGAMAFELATAEQNHAEAASPQSASATSGAAPQVRHVRGTVVVRESTPQRSSAVG